MDTLVLIPPSERFGNVVRDFVYGCWCKGRRIGGTQMPPTTHLFVATALKHAGHRVVFLDGTSEPERFAGLDPRGIELVVLLTSTTTFHEDLDAVRRLRSRGGRFRTAVFGPHPTFMPEHCLGATEVDFIVQREPEESLVALADALDRGEPPDRVAGIGFRGAGGEPVITPPRPPIEDMDALPWPDRTLLPAGVDYFNPVVRRLPFTTTQTSRGCPARCTFCTVPEFYGNRGRHRSAEHVLAELREIQDLGYREVFFRDETFTAFRERNMEICEGMLRGGIDLTWICNARVGTIDREAVRLMKRAGCHLIKIGVESGDQGILDRMRKGIRVEQTRADFALLRSEGLHTHAHCMLGCPGETEATIDATVRLVQEIRPSTASFVLLTPYPGTPIFRETARLHPEIRDGTGCDLDRLHTTAFFSDVYTEVPAATLERELRRAYRRFYFRPSYLADRLRDVGSLDELRRLARAGLFVAEFAVTGRE